MKILRDRGVEFDVVEYLHNPPDEGQLREFLTRLAGAPSELIHPGSLADLGLNIKNFNTPDAVIDLLLEYPKVMNRPVCLRGDRFVIARPAEKVYEILD